jgi:hypothetical protein
MPVCNNGALVRSILNRRDTKPIGRQICLAPVDAAGKEKCMLKRILIENYRRLYVDEDSMDATSRSETNLHG